MNSIILENNNRKFILSYENNIFRLKVFNLVTNDEIFNHTATSLIVLELMLDQWYDDTKQTEKLLEWANATYFNG